MATQNSNHCCLCLLSIHNIRALTNLKSSVIGPDINIDYYLPVLCYYIVIRVTEGSPVMALTAGCGDGVCNVIDFESG